MADSLVVSDLDDPQEDEQPEPPDEDLQKGEDAPADGNEPLDIGKVSPEKLRVTEESAARLRRTIENVMEGLDPDLRGKVRKFQLPEVLTGPRDLPDVPVIDTLALGKTATERQLDALGTVAERLSEVVRLTAEQRDLADEQRDLAIEQRDLARTAQKDAEAATKQSLRHGRRAVVAAWVAVLVSLLLGGAQLLMDQGGVESGPRPPVVRHY